METKLVLYYLKTVDNELIPHQTDFLPAPLS